MYKQIDGVSMGSPLRPIIAYIFMDDFENKQVKNLCELGVKSWDRFVDNIFVILKEKSKDELVLNYLNQQH